jgi:hypothetical protein
MSFSDGAYFLQGLTAALQILAHRSNHSYGARYRSNASWSCRESFARTRMCITTVPVIRGEIVIGGLWQREQFCWNTSSPLFCPVLRTAGAGGVDRVSVCACAISSAPPIHPLAAIAIMSNPVSKGNLRLSIVISPPAKAATEIDR